MKVKKSFEVLVKADWKIVKNFKSFIVKKLITIRFKIDRRKYSDIWVQIINYN